MNKKKTTHRDEVKKFTSKFHTTAVRFYGKVDQLTPHEASLAWCAWRQKSQDADLFFAWVLAYHFSLSTESVWYNKSLSAYGFVPDMISYVGLGCSESLTGLQLDDIDVEGEAAGFGVYLDGKHTKLKGSTFGEMLHDASLKLHVHACNSAMQAVRDAQRICNLL